MGIVLVPIVDKKLDVWMKKRITECHNMDFNEPPTVPPPQQLEALGYKKIFRFAGDFEPGKLMVMT